MMRRFPVGIGTQIGPATAQLLARPPVAPPKGAPLPIERTVVAPTKTPVPSPPAGTPGHGAPPAIPPSATEPDAGGTIRRSLLDTVPVSLFDRARRFLDGAGPARTDTAPDINSGVMTVSGAGQPIRRTVGEQDESGTGHGIDESLSPREWDRLVDLIVERIEDRITDELARRGRWFNSGAF